MTPALVAPASPETGQPATHPPTQPHTTQPRLANPTHNPALHTDWPSLAATPTHSHTHTHTHTATHTHTHRERAQTNCLPLSLSEWMRLSGVICLSRLNTH